MYASLQVCQVSLWIPLLLYIWVLLWLLGLMRCSRVLFTLESNYNDCVLKEVGYFPNHGTVICECCPFYVVSFIAVVWVLLYFVVPYLMFKFS